MSERPSREQPTCSHCGFSLNGETGLRYFGTHTAHQESRCIALLKMDADALTAENARLQGERDAVIEKWHRAEEIGGHQQLRASDAVGIRSLIAESELVSRAKLEELERRGPNKGQEDDATT